MDPMTREGMIIVGRDPGIVDLSWSDYDEDEDESTRTVYHLQTPYLYFVFRFAGADGMLSSMTQTVTVTDSMLYMSKHKIRSAIDPLWPATFPNVYDSGAICWGGTYTEARAMGEKIDELVNSFFITGFNRDLEENMPRKYGSFEDWQCAPHRDFEEWPEFDNEDAATSIRELLTDLPEAPLSVRTHIAPPPPIFTVRAAREWAAAATGRNRRVLLAGIDAAIRELEPEEAPEAVPA
jgi:hypothetical protein